MIRPFLIGLQFLTQVPVGLNGAITGRDQGRSILVYPLIGLLIGSVLAAVAWMLGDVPVLLRSALLLVVWVVITGGLHLDGLADSADAWVGGAGDADRTLAIMKDPSCGPIGVAAIILTLLLKFSALVTLCRTGTPSAIVIAPVLGRAALVLLFLTTAYVRKGGLGHALAERLPTAAAIWILIAVAGAVSLSTGAHGVWLLLGSIVVFLTLRAAAKRRLAGVTGDIAGAMLELIETAVLIVAAAL